MSTSATLQHTIQIRPSRFAGLLVAVATLTAVATWSIGNVNESSPSRATASLASAPSSSAKAYVDGVTALTPAQQAAIFGNLTEPQQHVEAITSLSPGDARGHLRQRLPDPAVRRGRDRAHPGRAGGDLRQRPRGQHSLTGDRGMVRSPLRGRPHCRAITRRSGRPARPCFQYPRTVATERDRRRSSKRWWRIWCIAAASPAAQILVPSVSVEARMAATNVCPLGSALVSHVPLDPRRVVSP